MAPFCVKYKNNCVFHVQASKASVGKAHGIASRSLLMEQKTGNVTVKIRGLSNMSRYSCYIGCLRKWKGSTGYS